MTKEKAPKERGIGAEWVSPAERLKLVPPPPCFRHPTRTARRKCYRCGRRLCPKCQHRAKGHIFCSSACASSHRWAHAMQTVARWNNAALSGAWFKVLLYSAFAIAAGLGFFAAWRMNWFVPDPSRESPISAPKAAAPAQANQPPMDWNAPGPVTITSPPTGTLVRANRLSVEGTAPPEAMVGLYVNDQKAAVQLTMDGNWRFDGIPLSGTMNLIQARYFDHVGNTSFSKAIAVRLQGLPAIPISPEVHLPEPLQLPSLDLRRAALGKRRVLLTFDGGSNSNSTEVILASLKSHGIRSTIFLTGEYIRKYPELVKEMVAQGHVVANHSLSHPHLTTYSFDQRQTTLKGVSKEFVQIQLARANDLFKALTGRDFSPYWRAPFGEYNKEILSWAGELGYRHVYWTPHLDTLDWVVDKESPLYNGPGQILSKILGRADRAAGGVDGGIILMHLGTEREGEQSAHTILEPLIRELSDRGYSFVDIDEAWPAGAAPKEAAGSK